LEQERRFSARHPIDLPVYIRYWRRPFLAARAVEMSASGMTLAVQSLTLPIGTPIELEFSALGRAWLVPAVVVHGDNAGIGVMFRERQPELYEALSVTADMPPPLLPGLTAAADSRT
jgi:hypothetical protein